MAEKKASMAKPEREDQVRIMIWSTPRSLSTAFARSMSARGDTMVFWEPYLNCFYYGPDRTTDFGDFAGYREMLNDKYTYSYIQGFLKADYPDAKVLFVKGMVEGIVGHHDIVDRRYKHSFLIRHPRKMYRSFYRAYLKMKDLQVDMSMDDMLALGMRTIYQGVEQFYHYVEVEMGQPSPPIIDADDLASQPERLLPKYCEAMGIEYTTRMLSWESVDPSQLDWQCIDVGCIRYPSIMRDAYLGNALKGGGFGKAPGLTQTDEDVELSEDMEAAINLAMPIYERMHALRIQP